MKRFWCAVAAAVAALIGIVVLGNSMDVFTAELPIVLVYWALYGLGLLAVFGALVGLAWRLARSRSRTGRAWAVASAFSAWAGLCGFVLLVLSWGLSDEDGTSPIPVSPPLLLLYLAGVLTAIFLVLAAQRPRRVEPTGHCGT